MSARTNVIDFIPKEEYERQMADTFEEIASSHGNIAIPKTKDFDRKKVVEAFTSAFEMIGGVPRLAVWANEHETEFFKIFARLLPSQASSALGESNELTIHHILPRTPLDG